MNGGKSAITNWTTKMKIKKERAKLAVKRDEARNQMNAMTADVKKAA